MSLSKDKWFEEQNKDPKNWITRTCQHCGEKYKVNIVTNPDPDSEVHFCPDCHTRFNIGKD